MPKITGFHLHLKAKSEIENGSLFEKLFLISIIYRYRKLETVACCPNLQNARISLLDLKFYFSWQMQGLTNVEAFFKVIPLKL